MRLTRFSLHCSSVGCLRPSETTSQRRTMQRRRRWQPTRIFYGTPGVRRQSQWSQIRSLQCQFAPLRPAAAPNLRTAAPGRPIAEVVEGASRLAAPHLDARITRLSAPVMGCAKTTEGTATRPTTATGKIVSLRKTRSPPWAAQCSRRAHLPPGFGI